MTIGEKIRELRRQRDWSQSELGEKVGIPGQNVSRYETNRVVPRTKTLAQLAEAFEVPIEVFSELASAHTATEIEDPELLDYFRQITTLEPEDQEAIKRVMKAMINNKRAQSLLAS